MLAALELVADKASKTRFDAALDLSNRLANAGYRNGIIFRAFADGTVGLAPALSCSEDDMDGAARPARARTLDAVLDEAEVRRAIV